MKNETTAKPAGKRYAGTTGSIIYAILIGFLINSVLWRITQAKFDDIIYPIVILPIVITACALSFKSNV